MTYERVESKNVFILRNGNSAPLNDSSPPRALGTAPLPPVSLKLALREAHRRGIVQLSSSCVWLVSLSAILAVRPCYSLGFLPF